MKQNRSLIRLLSIVLVAVLALAVFADMTPMSVRATETDELQSQIDEVNAERVELAKRMNALKNDIANTDTEIVRIVKEKMIIDQEIGLINQDILLLNQQILSYGMLIADKQDELDAAQARLEEMTAKNKERIRTMEEDGSLSYWSVLFCARDFADLLDRLNMVEEIANADRRRLEGMRNARQEVVAAQEALNAEKAQLESARVEIQQRQEQLAEKRIAAEKKMAELKERQKEYEELLEKAEDADNRLIAQIIELQKQFDDANASDEKPVVPPVYVGAGEGATTVKPPESVTEGLEWVMPCEYTNVCDPFGWRIHPITGELKLHDGIDLANKEGTPIYATRSGVVNIAGFEEDGAGYYVSVNHGDGFSSVYMHMTHYVVKMNQKVEAGELLGYMGSTGLSTGSHLHFAMSYDGHSQNPADYLDFE